MVTSTNDSIQEEGKDEKKKKKKKPESIMNVNQAGCSSQVQDEHIDVVGDVEVRNENMPARTFKFSNQHGEEEVTPGLVCNARVIYIENDLSLWITVINEEEEPRSVSLEDWNSVFRNAKCQEMIIESDQEIPAVFMEEILCCETIMRTEFFGGPIHQDSLDRLSAFVSNDIRITVDSWDPKLTGLSKVSRIGIHYINFMDDIIESMKSVPTIAIDLHWSHFVHSVHRLAQLIGKTQHLPYWHIRFNSIPSLTQIDLVNEYLEEVTNIIYGDQVMIRFLIDPDELHTTLMILPVDTNSNNNNDIYA
ncbi:unnamed protein product [Caenorhabditis angaria]|uniref:Uncharacterized protein n=1 Tax=Caenorhabditis angaria TaxID=860376 RepID=A0A9P1J5T3_9PELO|nr:unnamed protein product [Caenorhabditis angaria]